MPPRGRGRKKAESVKKKAATPTRRPSTRRSTAAAARESLVIHEVEDDVVEVAAVTSGEAHGGGGDEESGTGMNVDVTSSVVATGEMEMEKEKEKDGSFRVGSSEVKVIDANSVESSVVYAMDKEEDASFFETPVVPNEGKMNDSPCVETPVLVDLKREVFSLESPELRTPILVANVSEPAVKNIIKEVEVSEKSNVVNKKEQEENESFVGTVVDRECNYLDNAEPVTSATKDVRSDVKCDPNADIVNHELDVSVDAASSSGVVVTEPETRMEVDDMSIAGKKDCSKKIIEENNKDKAEEVVTLDGDEKVVVLEKIDETGLVEETTSVDAHDSDVKVAMLESIDTTDKAEEASTDVGDGDEKVSMLENIDTTDKAEEPPSTDVDDGDEKVAMLESIDTIDKAEETSIDTCDKVKKIGKDAALTNDSNGEAKVVVLERIEENVKPEISPSLIAGVEDEEDAMIERQRQRKTEIFIGGLDREATEDDIKNVFGKIGEIVEVRLLLDAVTKKNKGYAFLRYATAAIAKQAVSEFSKVEVCGKICGAAALEGNDTIFLGNIDKNWKKEDVLRLLQDFGIDKIDTVTVLSDPNNADVNRGFAYLELETNRDAQIAYKKLQNKEAFGVGKNVKVAWSKQLDDVDDEDKQKIKSVFAESVPDSWDKEKVKECFRKYGDIERVVLARDIPSCKRKDFAFVNYTTREAALSCIEEFEKDELFYNGTKVDIKVSLSKTTQKSKLNKNISKFGNKDISKDRWNSVQRNKHATSSRGAKSFKGTYVNTSWDKRQGFFQRDKHSVWKQGSSSYGTGPVFQNYQYPPSVEKRPYSSIGDATLSDPRHFPRPRIGDYYPPAQAAQPSIFPSNIPPGPGASHPYYHQHQHQHRLQIHHQNLPNVGYGRGGAGPFYGPSDPSLAHQPRYGNPLPPHPPYYGNNGYPRY